MSTEIESSELLILIESVASLKNVCPCKKLRPNPKRKIAGFVFNLYPYFIPN